MGNSKSKKKQLTKSKDSNIQPSKDWKKLNDPPSAFSPRFDHSLVALNSSKVLLFGGMAEGWQWKKDLWEFDLQKNEWREINLKGDEKDIPCPMKDHAVTIDEDGKKMYVFGGKTEGKRSLHNLWELDVEKMMWTCLEATNSFPEKRYGASLAIRGKKLYLFGGKRHTKDSEGLKDLWEFDIENNTWKEISVLSDEKPGGLVYHGAVIFKNEMIISCGYKEKTPLTDMWSLNLDSFEWKKLKDAPIPPRSGHTVSLLGGSMFLFGGEGACDGGVTCENDLWIYKIESQKWEEVKFQNFPEKRLGVKSVFAGDKFLISCGIKVSKEWQPEEWMKDIWVLSNVLLT